MNSILWNSGREEDKEIARKRKRRLHHVSNILVISDPANRAAEGKVFLFKYGVKIFDKANDLMKPQFPGDVAVNPYDLWEGADFRLKIRNVEDYRNYDKSEFAAPSAVSTDETRLREIYDSLYPLKPFVEPGFYKTYAELKRKLTEVLGEEAATSTMSPGQMMDYDTTAEARPARSVREPESIGGATNHRATDSFDETPFPPDSDDEGAGSMAYFAKLARGEA